jgi:hypothetical protein
MRAELHPNDAVPESLVLVPVLTPVLVTVLEPELERVRTMLVCIVITLIVGAVLVRGIAVYPRLCADLAKWENGWLDLLTVPLLCVFGSTDDLRNLEFPSFAPDDVQSFGGKGNLLVGTVGSEPGHDDLFRPGFAFNIPLPEVFVVATV